MISVLCFFFLGGEDEGVGEGISELLPQGLIILGYLIGEIDI